MGIHGPHHRMWPSPQGEDMRSTTLYCNCTKLDTLLPRPLSDHGSGTSSLAPRPMLGDCLDHSPTTARGLCISTTCDRQLAYSWGYSFSFRPCYKAHTSPSSKLGDYIGTMHLPVHLVSPVRRLDSQLNWEFFLDPGTMCLRHLLPGSGTKWAHFTLR